MEIEKVKEIKTALENCQKNNCLDCPYFIDEKRCSANDLLLDAINLINELESENEKLQRDYVVNAYDKLRAENKKLKDRLAELEDKIENGTLVELPYKVGDTATAIIDTLLYDNSIQNVKIKGLAYIVEDENGDTTFQHISRVFHNKSEAEAKLEELQEDKK